MKEEGCMWERWRERIREV